MSELTGKLLIASPSLQDTNFRRSVVLVCQHDEEGCMGLVVNRPKPLTVHEVLHDLAIPEHGPDHERSQLRTRHVYEGGPVDVIRGFILHDAWHVYESTMIVNDELNLTASRDILEAIGLGEGPEHYLMMLGYAGWGTGQLEQELLHNDWLIAPASPRILFQEKAEQRWEFGIRCMGIDPAHLSDQFGHA